MIVNGIIYDTLNCTITKCPLKENKWEIILDIGNAAFELPILFENPEEATKFIYAARFEIREY